MTPILTAAFIIFVTFILWILIPYIYRKYEILKLNNICAKKRILVLSYDDGPSSSFTMKLLELLAEYGAPATFFALGRQVEENPSIIEFVKEGNHEIGNHSYSHVNAWKGLPWSVSNDIRTGKAVLEKYGCNPTLFRPPNGKITLATLVQTLLSKTHFAWWTIDSTDTHAQTGDINTLKETLRRKRGGVVLLHDFERVNDPGRNDFVLEATRSLLEMAKNENFEVCRFGDLRSLRN